MMKKTDFLDSSCKDVALWCSNDIASGDLARVAEWVIQKNIKLLSVGMSAIPVIWPWVENVDVKIVTRFYFSNKKITEKQVSDITQNINSAFKQGAHGAQVLLPYVALRDLVAQTHVIRDDLFFNKDLTIGLDINEIDSCDWQNLFENLRKINASSLMLVLTKDAGNKSDFVGRIYGMLDSWNAENKFDLHFAFGQNFHRIEQTRRLVKAMQPQLIKGMKFFVNY
ncbi:MAG: hypothetical protein J6R99_04000 [Alphaproteobacteria bacterium]|nr:hypothetical protein [Alphaproteobacteria bacterium]